MNHPKLPETTAHNPLDVQAPSKRAKVKLPPSAPRSSMRLAVNNRRYWEGRIYRESYVRGGERFSVPEYYCKLNHAGKRRAFNLGTANKEAAAEKARAIWEHLVQHGWPSVLQKYAPTAARTNLAPTVSEFLAEVERTAGLKPRTFHRYGMYFRSIVAHVAGIKDQDGRRFDYRTGGRAEWIAKVNRVSLEKLTPQAAADWKAHYLSRAGKNALQQLQTARAFNAALRSAKSLFSSRIINADNFRVRVPKFRTHDSQVGEREIYWFENLAFEKSGSMKFSPPEGVTYQSLIVAARNELRGKEPDAYLLLLLCLCAGLRRGEADVLKWDQIHFEDCYIAIEANEFIQPKHGSGGPVYAEPELLKELLSFKSRATGSFVVNSRMTWKSTIHFRYRCEPHWKVLNTWLTGKGIVDRKKIQTLRKMFGDAITKTKGIFAGAAQLRHTSLQVAVKHYTDPRQRAPLSVAGLLSDTPVKPVPTDEVEEIIARVAELPHKSVTKILKAVKAILVSPQVSDDRRVLRPKTQLAA